jgi:hypothetical protein
MTWAVAGDQVKRQRKEKSKMQNETIEHHEVQVYIDRIERASPNPTTGHALYVLGEIKAGYDLWEEEPGPTDDKLVTDDATEVRLKNFTHFYSAQRDLNPGGGNA